LVACGGGGDGPTPPPSLAGVTAAPTAATILGVGGTTVLSAAIQPAGASATIDWSSGNTAVATVAGSGTRATVTGVSGGTAQITARAGAFAATVLVTVTPVARSVSLIADTLRLVVGDSVAQAATIDADAGADTRLAWRTTDPAVASVDAAGQVTAVAEGITALTVSLPAFPGITASRPVRVRAPAVEVSVAPSSLALRIGDTVSLIANVSAPSGTATAVEWTTSAAAIATVDGRGRVSAVAVGTARIVATSVANPTASAFATVTVRAPTVQAIVVRPDSLTLRTGASEPLQATVTADPGVSTAINWRSSDEAIATVSAAGVVTAVSPGGPVIISATSSVVPSVADSARVVVEAAPANAAFLSQRIGVGGSAGGLGGHVLVHFGDDAVLAGLGFQSAGGGVYRNRLLRLSGGITSDVTAACCSTAGLPTAIAGRSVDDALVSFSGDILSGGAPSVQRRTAGGYVDTNWPRPAGFSTEHVAHLRAASGGAYLALTSEAVVQRYTAGGWTVLDTIDFGGGEFRGEAVLLDDDELVAYGCSAVKLPLLFRWKSGVITSLPVPPTSCDNIFDTTLGGRSLSTLTATDRTGVYRFSGTAWMLLAPSVVGGDTIRTVVPCGTRDYAASRSGRVFERDGGQFRSIGEPGVITALSEFSASAVLDCTPTGPLRVLSGSARLVRRSGAGWAEENFAPTLRALHVSSPTNAFAVGDGVVYRFNGASWSRRHVFTEPDLRMTGVVTRGPGDMLAVGEIRRSSGGGGSRAGMLRYDGTQWTVTSLPQYSGVDRLVAFGATDVLARVGTTVGSQQTVARWDGATWSTLTVGLPNVTQLAASGDTHAMALASSGDVARYDGVSWQPMPAIPGGFQSFTGALFTTSPSFAMAGNCVSSGSARLVRWDGTAWTDTPMPAQPTVTCVRSLFGTSPADVYALVSSAASETVTALLHWNGVIWAEVSVTDVGDARAGGAVPGLSLLTGFRAFTAVSRPPLAARRGR
jgi:uncharacterized protein YjdB